MVISLEWSNVPILIGAGVLVGFINTLAGGGSVISLSLLMFMGLPPGVANGTNRIAILLQNMVAVGSYKHQHVLDVKKGFLLAIPSVLGSVLGAWIAVDLDSVILERAMGVVMIVMLFFVTFQPQRLLNERVDKMNKSVTLEQCLLFFGIGVYGGFIQLGVGYFLLGGFVLSAGYEIVKANALKVFVVLMYTPVALVVFAMNHQVNYLYGIILAFGSMGGALIASRLAVKHGGAFVRWVLIVVIVLTALHLFGLLR